MRQARSHRAGDVGRQRPRHHRRKQTIRSETFRRLARSPAGSTTSSMAIVVKMIFRGDLAVTCRRAFFADPVTHLFVQNADTDAARGNHLAETRGVVLGPAFQRDEQGLALETDPPMNIYGVITAFDRISTRALVAA